LLVGAGANKGIKNNDGLFVASDISASEKSESNKANVLLDLLRANNAPTMTETANYDNMPDTLTGLTARSPKTI